MMEMAPEEYAGLVLTEAHDFTDFEDAQNLTHYNVFIGLDTIENPSTDFVAGAVSFMGGGLLIELKDNYPFTVTLRIVPKDEADDEPQGLTYNPDTKTLSGSTIFETGTYGGHADIILPDNGLYEILQQKYDQNATLSVTGRIVLHPRDAEEILIEFPSAKDTLTPKAQFTTGVEFSVNTSAHEIKAVPLMTGVWELFLYYTGIKTGDPVDIDLTLNV